MSISLPITPLRLRSSTPSPFWGCFFNLWFEGWAQGVSASLILFQSLPRISLSLFKQRRNSPGPNDFWHIKSYHRTAFCFAYPTDISYSLCFFSANKCCPRSMLYLLLLSLPLSSLILMVSYIVEAQALLVCDSAGTTDRAGLRMIIYFPLWMPIRHHSWVNRAFFHYLPYPSLGRQNISTSNRRFITSLTFSVHTQSSAVASGRGR